MANFTTRVELYGSPTWQDYENLHSAMQQEGFSRTISFEGDSTIWQLPPGEYNCGKETDVTGVTTAAKRAVATVWTDFALLVTKCDGGRGIHNLRKS